MDEELADGGLESLVRLLDERGIKHCEAVAPETETVIFFDGVGDPHQCWGAGSDGHINTIICVTPEEALSVERLNGVISTNAEMRELISDMWTCVSESEYDDCSYCSRLDVCVGGISDFSDRMRELGIEEPEWKIPRERDNELVRENRDLRKLVAGLAKTISMMEKGLNDVSARLSGLARTEHVTTFNAMEVWGPFLRSHGIEVPE